MIQQNAVLDTLHPAYTLHLRRRRTVSDDYLITTVLGERYNTRFWQKVQKTETCWLWTGHTRAGCHQLPLTASGLA